MDKVSQPPQKMSSASNALPTTECAPGRRTYAPIPTDQSRDDMPPTDQPRDHGTAYVASTPSNKNSLHAQRPIRREAKFGFLCQMSY